ncbi:CD209 antigen-like protein E [Thalassophryne amazonica]|uniref:CD209 antigen-like protein E n=1 Tax=Thalassophryne amazonica TaxID=390379 RepID=UPI0014711FC5|nr:CD209 antigen-like protein E [Thalassophryne amazonica]
MSECIYDNDPKGSLQVEEIGLSTVKQADEAEEKIVIIYDSADNYLNQDSGLNSEKAGAQKPSYQPCGRTACRSTAVCLGLLCLLLTGALVGFGLVCRNKAQTFSKTLVELRSFCRNGCSSFSNSFYYVSSEKKSWEDSRQACKDRDADLVIINSKEEQEFINSLNPMYWWIGLSDQDEEGVWKWVDGTVLSNTSFWGQRQPSGTFGTNKDCVYTYRYSQLNNWNDEKCTKWNHWICEKLIDS